MVFKGLGFGRIFYYNNYYKLVNLKLVMKVVSKVTWDAEKALEGVSEINCRTVVEHAEESYEFEMILDSGKKLDSYFSGVNVGSLGIGGMLDAGSHWYPYRRFPGRVVGELVGDIDPEEFIKGCKDFHGLFYILPRLESVSHERYSKFFGSNNGGIWELDLCDYLKGTYTEQFVQTTYDMVNRHWEIYGWTNSAWPLVRAMEKDAETRDLFDKEIAPVLRSMGQHTTKIELKSLLERLKEFPVVRDNWDLNTLDVD